MNSAVVQNPRTATILSQAIGPEFDYWHKQLTEPENILLIKLGGLVVDRQLDIVADAVQTLTELGVATGIVHGAQKQINTNLAAKGIPKGEMIDGLRVTSEESLDVISQTEREVSRRIREALVLRGVNARSLTEGIYTSDYIDVEKYGLVGEVTDINTEPILQVFENGGVPILGYLGTSKEGEKVNQNADEAASRAAIALKVSRFVILGEPGGVTTKQGVIIPVLNIISGDIERLIEDGTIHSGMIPKVQTAINAVMGLPDTSSATMAQAQDLILEVFTHEGKGTQVRKGDKIIPYDDVTAVDRHQLTRLINRSFNGGTLAPTYFENLDPNAEVFTTAQEYNGVAIVVPQHDSNGKTLPAYIDKIATIPELRGRGIGRELVQKAHDLHPEGLVLRAKNSSEENIRWYGGFAQNEGTHGDWTVFTIGVSNEHKEESIKRAMSHEATILY